MRDSKTLTQQVATQIKASSKNTPIAAGQTDSSSADSQTAVDKDVVIDAINQMFAEFELVYHNQYNKAFATPEKLMYAKKLWFSHLKSYYPEQILRAAQRAIRESEYLPTVRGILKYLDNDFSHFGLPEPHAAYVEACRAPSPKTEFNWSHPAVYFAGRESDWYFLANSAEKVAFPVFERNYRILCERVIRGEEIDLPVAKALPEDITTPLSLEEQKAHLQKLREETGI